MSAADEACSALRRAGVELLTAVPDSLLAPLCAAAATTSNGLRYIQTCDEGAAFAVAAGATLAGMPAAVAMESSGMRQGCDVITRLVMAHRLHTLLLLSGRGEFGEPNWWAIRHERSMNDHLSALAIPMCRIDSLVALEDATRRGLAMVRTGQTSAALVLSKSLCAELSAAIK